MSQKKVAVSVRGVSKSFHLPHERADTVKSLFVNPFQKRLKKDNELQHALRDISFDIKEGEFFGIVGRNGSGKSTLLKIIAGIYQPNAGSVEVNGRLVPFIELGVGFNPELTGRENVYLNGSLMGFSTKEIEKRYHDIVAFAELERFMDQKLKNYSSGMQVRLAFSVATLLAQSDILLIDEVLAVGDADFQRKCFNYFKQIKKAKKTVIFISHDMDAIRSFCDRAALIDKSRVVEVGTTDRIAAMYSRLFQANTQQQLIKSDDNRWGDGQMTWRSVRAIVKGKDPEAIEIVARGVAQQDVEVPIFGFSIKNGEKTQLIGTNTVRKNIKPKSLKKGESFTVRWKVPNVFNRGIYHIDCTAAHDQPTVVAERWPEAAEFAIHRKEDNPYLVYSPAMEFDIELKKARS